MSKVPRPELLDRKREQETLRTAVSAHPRVLISGDSKAGLGEFVAWFAQDTSDRTLLHWDFQIAPGVEGVDMLRALATDLRQANRFEAACEEVKTEFANAPSVKASQTVGSRASAGRDQMVSAHLGIPTLQDYYRDNLHRLASALMQDICTACEQGSVVLIMSGIVIDGDKPRPTKHLLNIITSTMWRGAEKCEASGLCVVFASSGHTGILSKTTPASETALGLISPADSVEVLSAVIPTLSASEATAVVQSAMQPEAAGLTYSELRERAVLLRLNRLEHTWQDIGD